MAEFDPILRSSEMCLSIIFPLMLSSRHDMILYRSYDVFLSCIVAKFTKTAVEW